VKKIRKRSRTIRRHRGGFPGQLIPPGGPPSWPPEDGCARVSFASIEIPENSFLDRLGDTRGRFVAILEAGTRGEPLPSSYEARAMRALGETPFNVTINGKVIDLRHVLYTMIYNDKNDPDNELYYVLKVLKPFTALRPCPADNAFGYRARAFQLGLPDTIQNLITNGTLEKLTPERMIEELGTDFPSHPPYFNRATDTNINFVPFDKRLIEVINHYKEKAGAVPLTPPSGVRQLMPTRQTTVLPPPRKQEPSYSPAFKIDFGSPTPKTIVKTKTIVQTRRAYHPHPLYPARHSTSSSTNEQEAPKTPTKKRRDPSLMPPWSPLRPPANNPLRTTSSQSVGFTSSRPSTQEAPVSTQPLGFSPLRRPSTRV